MRVLSLFSGVGGFDLGLEAAGMTTVFQCEIDRHARSVLDHHWPDIPKWDDVTTLTGRHILDVAGPIDVVAWGSPCQDLSVAGKRAGLAGERSGLFHQGIRIIRELRELTDGASPRWSVWENVYGALSSNRGADFGEVLWEMDEAGACFSEWAVLDAQYFGVPQRRRRVFLVSCFDSATAAGCPEPLLPVAESLRGDSSEGRTTGEGSAGTVASSVGGTEIGDPIASQPGGMVRLGGHAWEGGPVPTLRAEVRRGDNEPHIAQPVSVDVEGNEIAATLRGFGHGWQGQHNSTNAVVQQPIGFSHTQGLSAQPSEEAFPTLRSNGGGMAVSYDEYNNSLDDQKHHSLRSGTKQSTGVLVDMVVRRLTPLECERLMGWPDNHTAIGINGPIADTNRYTMCANGVASPVAQWIGRHINAVTPMLTDNG